MAVLVSALGVLVPAVAVAAPATYFVRDGGTGTECTETNPCGTVQEAIDAHRDNPEPGDVVDVGPGMFVGNFGADQPADDGLTIRGTIDGANRATTLRGSDLGFDDSLFAAIVGACGAAEVTVRDLALDTEGADPAVAAVALDGGSDLRNVHARNQDLVESEAGLVVQTCQRGSQIDQSEIVGGDVDMGLLTFGGLKLTESAVTAEDASAVMDASFFNPRPLNVRRSTLASAESGSSPTLVGSASLTLDSSLVLGGVAGVAPFAIGEWTINNSTIDAGVAGDVDPGTPSLLLDASLPDPASLVTVDSSVLVDGIDASFGEGTVACDHSDLPAPTVGIDWVDQCPIGDRGNETTDPGDLFVGGAPYNFRLQPGSPAIDTGRPGAIPDGLAIRDLIGAPRRSAGFGVNCPDPIRDKGAYEFAGPPCSITPPTMTNGAAPTVGTKLGSNPGGWTNNPTTFQNRFLRCDASGAACTPIMSYRNMPANYRVRAADVGHTLRVEYLVSNAVGDSEPAVSLPSGVVVQDVPVNSALPTIENASDPVKGTTLDSLPGTWTNPPATYERQWLRCDPVGLNCSEITVYRERKSYTPRTVDVGATLRVRVIATNAGGPSEPATSEPSGVVRE